MILFVFEVPQQFEAVTLKLACTLGLKIQWCRTDNLSLFSEGCKM